MTTTDTTVTDVTEKKTDAIAKKLTKKEVQAAQLAVFREKIASRLGLDDKTGVSYKAGETSDYETTLIEGLTPEICKLVQHNDTLFVAGTTGAVLDKAKQAFAANQDLATVTATVPMLGKNHVEIIANRNGTASVAVVTTVANARAGDLKAAFDEFDAAMAVAEKEA